MHCMGLLVCRGCPVPDLHCSNNRNAMQNMAGNQLRTHNQFRSACVVNVFQRILGHFHPSKEALVILSGLRTRASHGLSSGSRHSCLCTALSDDELVTAKAAWQGGCSTRAAQRMHSPCRLDGAARHDIHEYLRGVKEASEGQMCPQLCTAVYTEGGGGHAHGRAIVAAAA